jgi:peptide/nickel transport system substrate-binding protein
MHRISRRDFLRVSTLAGAATLAAACGGTPTSPAPAEPTAQPVAAPAAQPTAAPAAPAAPVEVPAKFNEAPMLAELVAKGELPPVDERLPENPAVIPVIEMVGKYGGNIRRGYKGMSDYTGQTYFTWNSLTRFNYDSTLAPMLAESWEMSDDAKVWTWHLRKGTKWSDGQPLTTKDTQWWWQNHVHNAEISPSGDGVYKTGAGDDRKECELETPDDFTIVMKFAHPNPLFGLQVIWRSFPMLPGHYLEQFHADFADKAVLDKMVADKGLNTWVDLYNNQRQENLNHEVPKLDTWVPTNEAGAEIHIMVRNPYWWAVDPEGNQLPYVDSITHRLFETLDVFNMWIVNGEIDFQSRHVDLANYTLFKEKQEQGGYNITISVGASHVAVQINHTSKDPVLRKFFQNRDVRFALNYAVDREEMNELVFDGLLTPKQYSPLKKSDLWYEEQAFAHLEFDPDKSNELLDAAGYSEKDADGFRVDPETKETISFEMEGLEPSGSMYEDAMIMVADYWGKVGVKCTYKYSERSLYEEHQQANDMNVGTWSADRADFPLIDPGIFLATNTQRPWACAWGKWKNDPTDPNAEEPPEGHFIRTMWDLWEQCKIEADYEKRRRLFWDILDVWKEEIPMPTFLGEWPSLVIQKKTLRNYVAGYINSWLSHGKSFLNSSTVFWEDPENHTYEI